MAGALPARAQAGKPDARQPDSLMPAFGLPEFAPAGPPDFTPPPIRQVRILFGPDTGAPTLSDYTLSVVKDILLKAGIAQAAISSTTRTAITQMQAMYANLEATGVERQRQLYGPSGNAVIDAYVNAVHAGKTGHDVRATMLAKILEIGAYRISRHCGDFHALQTLDIDPRSVPVEQWALLEQAARTELGQRVSRVIAPPLDTALHLEIPQPPGIRGRLASRGASAPPDRDAPCYLVRMDRSCVTFLTASDYRRLMPSRQSSQHRHNPASRRHGRLRHPTRS